jgi:hypothetical protein
VSPAITSISRRSLSLATYWGGQCETVPLAFRYSRTCAETAGSETAQASEGAGARTISGPLPAMPPAPILVVVDTSTLSKSVEVFMRPHGYRDSYRPPCYQRLWL